MTMFAEITEEVLKDTCRVTGLQFDARKGQIVMAAEETIQRWCLQGWARPFRENVPSRPRSTEPVTITPHNSSLGVLTTLEK